MHMYFYDSIFKMFVGGHRDKSEQEEIRVEGVGLITS